MITYNNTRDITNKWPGMIVVGEPVTVEQAAEILIRTDLHVPNFSHTGNDREFSRELNELFGFAEKREDEENSEYWNRNDALREQYKILDLGYLYNARILSSWMGGPHGWCDWDGTIGSCNTNIGKWPSVAEVAEEWQLIAEAFPYLNLQCQLFNGETCEDAKPVLIFTVKGGNVLVEDSDQAIGEFEYPDFSYLFLFRTGRGITIPELREKIKLVYGS